MKYKRRTKSVPPGIPFDTLLKEELLNDDLFFHYIVETVKYGDKTAKKCLFHAIRLRQDHSESSLKRLIKRYRKQIKEMRAEAVWSLNQDWSFGNHGPDGVDQALRNIVEISRARK